MAGNSAAALATLHLLGADVQRSAKNVSWFRNVAKKLQAESLRLPKGGAVTLIDDNYNAALISMKNGLEVAALYPRGENQRRIAVLGRLATLGELAQVSHEALAEPILEAGFDKVYMHGEEMLALKEKLPAQMIGGYFTDVNIMADKVLGDLQDGDVVLVKGSVSDSDFHLIIGKIKERVQSSVVPLGNEVATLRVNLNTEPFIADHLACRGTGGKDPSPERCRFGANHCRQRAPARASTGPERRPENEP